MILSEISTHSRAALCRLQTHAKYHPILSNSLLCLFFWTAGDIAAQLSEQKLQLSRNNNNNNREEACDEESSRATVRAITTTHPSPFQKQLDLPRTAKCATYGAAIDGPVLAVWYPYLERICVHYNLAARYGLWGPPVVKVLIDQLLMEPPSLVVFFGFMTASEEGGSWQTFQEKLETQLMPSWLTSLAIWPPVLLGTFRYFPTYAQAPFINVCLVAWNGFLSHRNTLAQQQEGNNTAMDQHGNTTATNHLFPHPTRSRLTTIRHSSLVPSERTELWRKMIEKGWNHRSV